MATTPAGHTDDALYHVWGLPSAGAVDRYYVESTAPVNIEQPRRLPGDVAQPKNFWRRLRDRLQAPYEVLDDGDLPHGACPLDDTTAARCLAERLAAHDGAEIVFLVNGFNTPRKGSGELLDRAGRSIATDATLNGHERLIVVGYRWPSETIGSPFRTSLLSSSIALRLAFLAFFLFLGIGIGDFNDTILALPGWLPAAARDWLQPLGGAAFWAWAEFATLAALVAAFLVMGRPFGITPWLVFPVVAAAWVWLCWLVGERLRDAAPDGFVRVMSTLWLVATLIAFMIPFGLFTLRLIVYFRDAYRAVTYGIPDLLQFLRDLDGALVAQHREHDTPIARVRLSFVAHSMGAFVVTNLIRVMSDVFAPQSAHAAPNSQHAAQEHTHMDPAIGDCLRMGRLILLSPDISATTLLSHRGNSLAAALRRCEEAYLFSSEGDGVLRTASTLANYFSFPTGRRAHGYRLGNTEVLGKPGEYGIIKRGEELTAAGFLASLRVGQQTMAELHLALNPTIVLEGERHDDSFPSLFTYFDCTAYRDRRADEPAGPPLGLLTWGQRRRLGLADHIALLVQYLSPLSRKIDIHGGYFQGQFSQELIYRLACCGFAATVESYATQPGGLHGACEARQIRVLLSPFRE